MKKYIRLYLIFSIVIIIGIVLSGCTTTNPTYIPIKAPKIKIPSEPRYPLQDLKSNTDDATLARMYAATLQLQHDFITEIKHVCTQN